MLPAPTSSTANSRYIRLVILGFFFIMTLTTGLMAAPLDDLMLEAEGGAAEAQVKLAFAFLTGQGIKNDYSKALYWYQKAAEQENPAGQTGLAYLYASGKGVAQDYAKALFYYQKAADQGFAQGQRPLGVLYELGQGVEKDPAQAAFWYRKAAEQGLDRAQVNLGILYENGTGVEKDLDQAVYWYQKAAASNYARGQMLLGRMYEKGLGVPLDLKQAADWYKKAIAQGYSKAVERLEKLKAQGITAEKPARKPISAAGAVKPKTPAPDIPSHPEPEPGDFLLVREDAVLVKKDPDAPPPFIIKVSKGTKVVEQARQGDWVSVIIPATGRSGWILSSQLTEKSEPAISERSPVQTREAAGH
jgi:TPR repeat protein